MKQASGHGLKLGLLIPKHTHTHLRRLSVNKFQHLSLQPVNILNRAAHLTLPVCLLNCLTLFLLTTWLLTYAVLVIVPFRLGGIVLIEVIAKICGDQIYKLELTLQIEKMDFAL